MAGLYDCDDLPGRILAISHAGDISLLSVDLVMKTTRPASAEGNTVLSCNVFSRASCSFLEVRTLGAVIVLVLERGTSVEVEVYQVGSDDSIDRAFTHEVPVGSTVCYFFVQLSTI